MSAYNSDNALREKVVWQANDRRLSVENFEGENVDELIKIHQYFPPSKFCAIRYTVHFKSPGWYAGISIQEMVNGH